MRAPVVGMLVAMLFAGIACTGPSLHVGPAQPPSFPQARCQPVEQLNTHYHAHLDLFVRGQAEPVPRGVGLRQDCLYWLHTHDNSGIIHVEAPADQEKTQFTLGSFFQVWGEPLASDRIGTATTRNGERVYTFVDGAQVQGDPRLVPVTEHAVIALELGSSPQPPPDFAWPDGF